MNGPEVFSLQILQSFPQAGGRMLLDVWAGPISDINGGAVGLHDDKLLVIPGLPPLYTLLIDSVYIHNDL